MNRSHMRKIKFVAGGFYHIYNRGARKGEIFYDDGDRLRFIYSMYKANSVKPVSNLNRMISRQNVQGLALNKLEDRFTNICYFALRPNHFHITLQQEKDEGVQIFMHRLGTSYTMYFNKKYNKSGVLFQGPFQAIPIEDDSYLMQISQYTHLNPLKAIEPEFREKGVKDFDKAKHFLRNYRWSSYLDYIGIENFPFLINNQLHNGYFGTPIEYEKFVLSGMKLFKA